MGRTRPNDRGNRIILDFSGGPATARRAGRARVARSRSTPGCCLPGWVYSGKGVVPHRSASSAPFHAPRPPGPDRPGAAIRLVFPGGRHFLAPAGPGSLGVGKRSGCVFRHQGRSDPGVEVPYQYVREPLTADEADRLANACETPTERLVVWTLLDTGLRVGELCALTSKDVLWQQRQLRFKGKGGPLRQEVQGPRRADVEPRAGDPGAPLRPGEGVPGPEAAGPGHRQGGGQPRRDHQGREPARPAAHVRDDGLAEGDQPGDGAEDPGPRPAADDGDLPELHRHAHPGRVPAEVVGGVPAGCRRGRIAGVRQFGREANRAVGRL